MVFKFLLALGAHEKTAIVAIGFEVDLENSRQLVLMKGPC